MNENMHNSKKMNNFKIKPINVLCLQQPTSQNCNLNAVPTVAARRSKVLNSEAREMVLNVIQMCEIERGKDGLLKPLNAFTARAAMYAGVTEEAVRDIHNIDFKSKEPVEAKKSGPKRKKQSKDKTVLDDRDIIKIKDIIRDYYVQHCKVPSVKELLPCILDQIPMYENNIKFLRRVLHNIGYRRKKLYSKQSVLVEDSIAISSRDEYLNTIRKLRSETRNIFYVYECIIDKSYTFHKSWVQKYGNNDALNDKQTYVLICAASINGFLKKATIVGKGYVNNSSSGQVTSAFFEKWLNEHLIPHLPKNSIIVMDDAPHHCTVADKPLSYCASKQEMIEYLKKKNIKCSDEMRRTELYKLIEDNTPKQKVYIVDGILKQHEHKVMRLPPYMIDLNPTQLAMDKIQQELYEIEYDGTFNLKNVAEIIIELMANVTQEQWDIIFEKTRSLEDEYWRKDEEFEAAMDKILQNLSNFNDSESENSSTDSADGDDV